MKTTPIKTGFVFIKRFACTFPVLAANEMLLNSVHAAEWAYVGSSEKQLK